MLFLYAAAQERPDIPNPYEERAVKQSQQTEQLKNQEQIINRLRQIIDSLQNTLTIEQNNSNTRVNNVSDAYDKLMKDILTKLEPIFSKWDINNNFQTFETETLADLKRIRETYGISGT